MKCCARNKIGYYTKLLSFCKQRTVQQSFRNMGLSLYACQLLLVLLPGTVSTPDDTSDQTCAAVKHSITAVAVLQ